MNLFYNYRHVGDILFVLIKDKETTSFKNYGDLIALYNDKEIIGYNFLNISKYIKIKYEGLIYLPPKEIIDLLNLLLNKYKLENLPYIKHSPFYIAKVTNYEEIKDNVFLYTLTTIDKEYKAILDNDYLLIDDKTVISIDGERMLNGRIFNSYFYDKVKINSFILRNYELKLSEDNNPIKIENDFKEGSDFFR